MIIGMRDGVMYMRIENYNTQRIMAAYNAQMKRDNDVKSVDRNAEDQRDSITISEEGQLVHKSVARIKELPDVRSDIVEKLRQSIASGQYVVDARQIVRKILDRKA